MSLTKVSWSMLDTSSVAATAIADKTSATNVTNKYAGLFIWDTTNNRLLRSSGGTDIAPWYVVDGSASVVPA